MAGLSLLDSLKQPEVVNTIAAPRAGTTQRLQDLIGGNKQSPQQGLALDTEEEQSALGDAKVSAGLVKQESSMADTRLKQKEEVQNQEFNFQAQDLEEKRINSQLEVANKSSDILTKASQNFTELNVKKQKSIAIFSMTLARFSHTDYLEKLQMEGQRQRLDSELSFKEALQASIFKDEEDLLRNDLNFKSMINADERAFKEDIAIMDIDMAIGLASRAAEAGQSATMYKAAGQGIQGTIQAGTAYMNRPSTSAAVPKERMEAGTPAPREFPVA